MRKQMKTITAALLACGILSACGTKQTSASSAAADDQKFKIVTTVFPEYDWVSQILGDNPAHAEVVLLQKGGSDLHSYQASAADIAEIASCDLFIYVGGESDEWVSDVLQNNPSDTRTDISLMDCVKDRLKVEEAVEGMEAAEHEEHDHEEPEYDEHVWLSLKNAVVICEKITEALAAEDPANAETYRINNTAYIGKLSQLDTDYAEAINASPLKTVLFADRFPFRYLADDYGLTYFAAFPGCSAETEASFETIVFLAGKTDELKLPAILTIEGTSHTIAETVRDNTAKKNQKILIMNSLQSAGMKDIENGVSYLSVMTDNLAVLKEALGN